jgi:hypothetical protein
MNHEYALSIITPQAKFFYYSVQMMYDAWCAWLIRTTLHRCIAADESIGEGFSHITVISSVEWLAMSHEAPANWDKYCFTTESNTVSTMS